MEGFCNDYSVGCFSDNGCGERRDLNYAGEPVFTAIESTDIEMAINTSFQALRYEGTYYLCHNAVWLTGFSANGPWIFADSVPAAFALIPPSSPAYNTTFVTIDGSSEEGINYAYTSGYEGAYISDSTVVYGTGYPSPAVSVTVVYGMYGGGYGYPYCPYYPWPRTYGHGSWYDPDSGRYGEATVGYGPWGAAGNAAVYNPATGAYARGQAVWDNDEFAGRGYAYNPSTNTSIARNRYVDFDDNVKVGARALSATAHYRATSRDRKAGRVRLIVTSTMAKSPVAAPSRRTARRLRLRSGVPGKASSGSSSLARDYRSRQNGFKRYSQHRSSSAMSSRSSRGSYGRRRRR